MNKEAIDKLKGTVPLLIRAFSICNLKKTLFDNINLKEISNENEYLLKCAMEMKYLFLADLIKDIANIVHDSDRRTASLATVVDKLKNDFVKAYFLSEWETEVLEFDDFGNESNTDESFNNQIRSELTRHKKALYEKVLKRYDLIDEKCESSNFKLARDKAIAHFEIKSKDNDAQFYNLKDFNINSDIIQEIMPMIEELIVDIALLVTGKYNLLQTIKQDHRRMATALKEKMESK